MQSTSAQHVLITGASSGLGAALALELSRKQHSLILLGRDRGRLEAVATQCREHGALVEVAACDIRDAAMMQTTLLSTDATRPLDIVIANAGIGGTDVLAGAEGETAENAKRIIDINLVGMINTIAPLQPRFVARRRGRFVVVSSMAAFEGLPEAPAYAASKAAVRIYGHGLRRLLAPHGVAVNVVTPGFVETPMSRSLPYEDPLQWSADRAAKRIIRGIDRNEAEILFPLHLRIGVALAGLLPARAADRAVAFARKALRSRT